MGKVIKHKIQGMNWWAKTSLVLLLTLVSSIFMYEGWYKPKPSEAAITVLTAPTSGYNAAAFPTSFAVTKPASTMGSRLLVVAVTSNIGTAATQTCTVTYGTQTLTKVVTDETVSKINHTWLFYLNEAGVTAASTTALVATVTGGTTEWNRVYYAFYDGVNQTTPITDSKNYNTATASATVGPFATALTIGAGDRAVEMVNITRVAGTTARTMNTWAANWTSLLGPNSSTTTNASSAYFAEDTTAGTTTSQHTASSTVVQSMSAMSLKMAPPTFTVGDGTNPAGGSAAQGSTGNALNAFTFQLASGAGSVSTMILTGSANFNSANVSAIKIYRDTGTTVGALDGSDVLVATSTAWASNVATVTFTTAESVSTTLANYLVVIDVTAGAVVGNTLSASVTAVTGSTLGNIIVYNDVSPTSTITTSGLTVGNGGKAANASAPQASLNNVMDAFTLGVGAGSGTVTTLTLTGSAQFTAANVGNIMIYRDKGTITALDNTDVLVPSTYSLAGTTATITFTTPEPVSASTAKYLVVIVPAAAATVGNTLSGTITAATTTGITGTSVYNDTSSGTLTIATGGTLTIGNSTDPVSTTAPLASKDNAMDGFSITLSAGTGQINTLTLTGSANFTTTNIATIKVLSDRGTVGTLDGSDLLIPTTYSHVGTTATITFTSPERLLAATAKNYLVTVNIQPGAAVGQTFTGAITAVTGSGWTGTPAISDSSATLTIAKANFANNSCSSCHSYTLYTDGSGRNNPTGAFVGSHGTHVNEYSMACSVCHIVPATTTSADFKHQTGVIQMATPINGNPGAAYGKGTSWPLTNSPSAPSNCTATYCHSQGVSQTLQTGDTTRSISAPNAVLNWGGTAACDSCHGYPPSYPNGATTWGGTAKANSHSVHTTHCETCHNATTTTGDSITNTANHAKGTYSIAAGNGVTIGSYTYNVAGGTCTDISCHGGVGINNAQWGTLLDCTTCHNKVVNSPRAQALLASVTTRRNIVNEFAQAWSHKRSAGGAVTKYDCCVCHMEGNPATGDVDLDYHGNGNIELRDPDTGAPIKGVTHSGTATTAGAYTSTANDAVFVQFSRNLSVTLEADPNFLTLGAIMTNLCLKCHDTDGAKSTLAQVPGGSALKPFATTITGHVAPYDSNGVGNVVDVNKSFATTNASYHPVRGKQNNSYVQGTTQMQAPYTATKTNGNNTQYGYLISCWDCHAPSAATGAQTSTVTAHGAIATLRGTIRVSGTTAATNLCLNCHALKYSATTHVSAGSALASGPDTGAMNNTYFSQCAYCHAYGPAAGANGFNSTARPVRAEDAHGFNDRTAGTPGSVWGTNNNLPYAFIRNTLTAWKPLSGNTVPAGSANCTGTASPCDNNMNSSAYTPGGAY